MKKWIYCSLILTTALLTACGSLADQPFRPSEQVQGDWQLREVVQGSLRFSLNEEDPAFTLNLDDSDRATGQVACNSWNGQLSLSDQRIRLTRTTSTRAFCRINDPRVSSLTQRFPAALETAARYEVSENELLIRTHKSERWTFHRVE